MVPCQLDDEEAELLLTGRAGLGRGRRGAEIWDSDGAIRRRSFF